jgi:hypothetical protein
MKKRTKPPTPARPKNLAPQHPLLSPEDQGKAYKVLGFTVQPEVTLMDGSGKVIRRYMPMVQNRDGSVRPMVLSLNEAQFGDTLPVFMEKLGLKMEKGHGR